MSGMAVEGWGKENVALAEAILKTKKSSLLLAKQHGNTLVRY